MTDDCINVLTTYDLPTFCTAYTGIFLIVNNYPGPSLFYKKLARDHLLTFRICYEARLILHL